MNAPLLIRNLAALSALSLALLLVAGCGGNPADARVIVTGTVMYKNQALTSGTVKFYNAKSEQISSANLQADGVFNATDIPMGDIKVTVETAGNSIGISGGKAPLSTPPMPGETPAGKSIAIPAKYKAVETSGLNYNISATNKKIEIKLD